MDLSKRFAEMEALMQRGIQKEYVSEKPYFTGYAYESLYDWDQYFEGIVQLYMNWGTKYLLSPVDIFLDYQKPNGFIPRAIDPPTLNRKDEPTELAPFMPLESQEGYDPTRIVREISKRPNWTFGSASKS